MPLGRKNEKDYYIPPRIIKGLDKSLKSPLTLIEAPSGFGKTVAVQEYMTHFISEECKKIWYTCLGESAVVAWKGICSILSQVDSDVARRIKLLGHLDNDSLVKLIFTLQEIRCTNETVVVIDNYQLICEDMPLRFLEAISKHNNPLLHFIIISQPAQISEVSFLKSSDIYYMNSQFFLFNSEDIHQLFLYRKIRLNDEEKAFVYEMTEGWAAAIDIYCMEYKFTGTFSKSEDIDELIENTIWNRLSERERELLLYISIFESFSIRQVCIILNKDSLPEYAENLIKSNILIRYEYNIQNFVIHSLLRKYLLMRIEVHSSSAEKFRIYAAAGMACAEEKQYYEAAKYFHIIEDFEQLLKLPLKGKDLANYLGKGSDVFIMKIIESTPVEILYKYPKIILVFAFELFLLGKINQFNQLCNIINDILNDKNILDSEIKKKLKGEFILLLSFTEFNDIFKMSKMHRSAYELLQGSSDIIVANHAWTFGAPSVVYMFWAKIGYLSEEIDKMEECIPFYSKLSNGHGSGAGEAMRAEAYLLAGEDSLSEAYCHKTIYTANMWGQDSLVLCAYLQLARIAFLRGDVSAYEQAAANIKNRVSIATEQRTEFVRDLCMSFLSLQIGKFNEVSPWLMNCCTISSGLYEVATAYGHIIHLRYLWLEGGLKNKAEILGLAEAYISMAEKLNFLLSKVYIYILLGILNQASSAFGDAQRYIDKALAIALPDKVYMPFAEMGHEIIPLLERSLLRQKDQDETQGIRSIIALTERYTQGVKRINVSLYKSKYKLTPREREVSILVQEGMNNQEIAEKLFISVYTVKNTLKKVFNKLDIKKREELKNIKL